MSKAFTREDDQADDELMAAPVSALPAGSPNLMTPAGWQRLQAEAAGLAARRTAIFPKARATPPDTEAQSELRKLDQRLRYLERSLRTAEVVAPPVVAPDMVQFGAEVSVRDGAGAIATYRLVGADETDGGGNGVSWFSPIGRALSQARVGDRVRLKTPRGEQALEITHIAYGAVEDKTRPKGVGP